MEGAGSLHHGGRRYARASQVGWSGTELVVDAPLLESLEGLVVGVLGLACALITIFTVILIGRIAKPSLWLLVPVITLSAVYGAFTGIIMEFDSIASGERDGRRYAVLFDVDRKMVAAYAIVGERLRAAPLSSLADA